jgi:hypothetical protein
LPPVQEGCELDSLDSVGNSKTKEKAIEVGFDGARRHFQFARNFRIVTTLQKEISNLLLPRAQANSLLRHPDYPEVPNTLK